MGWGEEANQFRRSKLQSTVVQLTTSLYGVANGLLPSGHATDSQYLGLTGPATTHGVVLDGAASVSSNPLGHRRESLALRSVGCDCT